MRQANGTGSYHKMSGNRRKPWRVRVTKGWVDGKQKFINLGYYATRKEAMAVLVKYNETPWDVSNDSLTFDKLYGMWYEEKEKTMDKYNLRGYASAYKHTEQIRKLIFKEIKHAHLQGVINEMQTKESSKKKAKQLFSQMYKFAMQNDIVEKDYSKFVTIPQDEEKDEKMPFTNEEVVKIYNTNEHNHDVIKVLLFTGMRINELLKMEMKNVHIEDGYMLGGSKTKSGKNRIIPISKFIKPIIEKWYDENRTLLVVNEKGAKLTYATYYRWWTMNIEGHTPHDARHTFVSYMNNANVNITSVKRIVGHSTGDVTEKVYTHKAIEDLKQAMNEFDTYVESCLSLS